jgi:hypothetical protein
MTVTVEQLWAFSASHMPPASRSESNRAGSSFDLEGFLAKYIAVKRGPEPYDDGERWIVQCPFDPEHGGTSAAIFRHTSGPGFKCQHDGCKDRHWKHVRDLFEPDNRTTSVGKQPSLKSERPTHLALTRADAVKIERVDWLAKERIPLGGVTLFDGPGGIGKTTFLTGVIANATRGVDFFTGLPIAPQSCLIVGIEDQRALIVQRLKLYGADLSRIHFVDAAHIGGKNVPLVLPDHVPQMEETIIALKVGLVYIDALFSHIALSGDGRMPQQARAAMQPIGEMCERVHVAFMAMRHWTKTLGSASSRALGSVEFTNIARSVFTFGAHPSEDGRIACSHTKSNYAKLTGAISFKIVATEVLDDNGEQWQVSIASAVAVAEGVTSDDLTMKAACDPVERMAAAEWLRDYLGDGKPHRRSDVLAAASKARAGAATTLWRAAQLLHISMERKGFPSVGMWTLSVASSDAAAKRTQPMAGVDDSFTHAATGMGATAEPDDKSHVNAFAEDGSERSPPTIPEIQGQALTICVLDGAKTSIEAKDPINPSNADERPCPENEGNDLAIRLSSKSEGQPLNAEVRIFTPDEIAEILELPWWRHYCKRCNRFHGPSDGDDSCIDLHPSAQDLQAWALTHDVSITLALFRAANLESKASNANREDRGSALGF